MQHTHINLLVRASLLAGLFLPVFREAFGQGATEILYSETFTNNPASRWDLTGNGTVLFPGSLPTNGTNPNIWSFNSNDPIIALPIDNENLHISCSAGNCGNTPGLTNLVKFNATLGENASNRVAFMKQDFDPASALNGPNLFLTFNFIFRKAFPENLDAAMRLIYSVNGGTTWQILQTYQGTNAPGVQSANPIPINSSTFAGYSTTLKKLRIGFLWRNKAPASAPNPAIDNGILIDNIVIFNQFNTVLNSVSPNTLCTGSRTSINFSASGFNPGTVFFAQLSDAGGSFGNPNLLGTVSPGVSQVTVPEGLQTSTDYRIRIVTDNGIVSNDLPVSIIRTPARPFAGGDVADCHGESVTIGGGTAETGVTYSWNVTALGNNLSPTLNLSNLGIVPVKATYILTATRSICSSRDSVDVFANPNPVVSAGVALQVCENDVPFTLVGTPQSSTTPTANPRYQGLWTGPGLSGSGNNVLFNPSGLTGPQTLTYKVTATYSTGGPGCEAEDTRVITVREAPEVEAGDPVTYCTKAGIQNWAGSFSPNNGTWSGPGVSPAGVFNPQALTPGTYVVTYTASQNGCSATDTRNVVITPPISVNAGPDTLTLCSYKLSHTMTGFTPPAETFGKWTSSPDPALIQTGGSLTFDTTDVGFHKLYYTYEKDKCRVTDSVLLTIVYAPIARSGPSNEVCANDSCFVLTGQYPPGGKWTGLGVDTSGSLFCPADSLVGSKLIRYRVNYSSGCFSEATRQVFVKPAPVINVGRNDTICASTKSITMTNFSPPGGIWRGKGISPTGLFRTGDTLLGNISVFYKITNANGCSEEREKQITIYPLPRALAGLDTASCTGLPLVLGEDSIPNLVYKWFEPIPGTIPVSDRHKAVVTLVNPKPTPEAFRVRLLVRDTLTGCENRDTVRILVYPKPFAEAIFPSPKALCAGDTFRVRARTRPNLTYEWLRNGLSLNIPSRNDTLLKAPSSGRYELVVRNTGAACTDTSLSDSLTIHPRFKPRITGTRRFCKDSTTRLEVVPRRPGFTFEWQYNGANVPDSTNFHFAVGRTGTVRVILLTDKGCRDSSAISAIDSLPVPFTGFLNDTVVCENQRAEFKAPVDSLFSYRWIDSATRSVISTNDTLFTGVAGKYYLEVFNECKIARDSVNLVRVVPLPRFGALNNGRRDTVVCQALPSRILGPPGFQSYEWTADSMGTGGVGRLYTIPVKDTVNFRLSLRVTDEFGCSNADTITIRVQTCEPQVHIPNSFSPQGDKINDLWRMQGYAVDEVKIYIFNRWGQMVFYTEDLKTGWDGSFKGTPCPSGAYKFLVEYKGDFNGKVLTKQQNGTITLIR